MRVVLPEPLAPSTPNTSPSRTESESPFKHLKRAVAERKLTSFDYVVGFH